MLTLYRTRSLSRRWRINLTPGTWTWFFLFVGATIQIVSPGCSVTAFGLKGTGTSLQENYVKILRHSFIDSSSHAACCSLVGDLVVTLGATLTSLYCKPGDRIQESVRVETQRGVCDKAPKPGKTKKKK